MPRSQRSLLMSARSRLIDLRGALGVTFVGLQTSLFTATLLRRRREVGRRSLCGLALALPVRWQAIPRGLYAWRACPRYFMSRLQREDHWSLATDPPPPAYRSPLTSYLCDVP